MSEELLPCPFPSGICKLEEQYGCVKCIYHTSWIDKDIWQSRQPSRVLDEQKCLDLAEEVCRNVLRISPKAIHNTVALAVAKEICQRFPPAVMSEMDLACTIGRSIYGKYWDMDDESQKKSFDAAKAIHTAMKEKTHENRN